MSHNTIRLLLGSNLFDREKNLSTAKSLIRNNLGEIKKESKIIETLPEGFESEYNFLNQVLHLETIYSPFQLLKEVKKIEKQMGRTYIGNQQRYQDRLIDIDILTFNQILFESSRLNLPHHQIYSRNFIKNILN
ncbi:MAG TPA: 2-amino-4-hydroxy-6-hydroxymethyldihydropteridine diphosphokinase [Moheibacter sp.]|nr:2-amino-4-hydroxy-6-hydroxymethyldihydropteridine diphosphokinase [Moheibacter sp.]